MITINMTREGLSAISALIEESPYLSQILDGRNHFTKNCEWTYDIINKRQSYKLHLPEDKIDILRFLFKSELENETTEKYWKNTFIENLGNGRQSWSEPYYNADKAKIMLKRILKTIK